MEELAFKFSPIQVYILLLKPVSTHVSYRDFKQQQRFP